jgi:soluble lytic murein transglycosylase-like protein
MLLSIQLNADQKFNPFQAFQDLNQVDHQVTLASQSNELPLYHVEQVRDILGIDVGLIASSSSTLELADYIRNRTIDLLPAQYRKHTVKVVKALIESGNRHHMDPLFLMAVIQQESQFNPTIIGEHGEIGLMQIKPSTVQWLLERDGLEVPSEDELKVSLMDPAVNIHYGSQYFAFLRDSFKGQHELYISAYNMGASNLRAHLKLGMVPHVYYSQVVARYSDLSLSANLQAHRNVGDADFTRMIASIDSTLVR